MKYSNKKMVIDFIDGTTSVDFTVVNFETGEIRTHQSVPSDKFSLMALEEHEKSRPAGGVEFWDGDTLNGTWTPEMLDELIELRKGDGHE